MGKRSIDKHEDFISLSAYKAGLKEGFMVGVGAVISEVVVILA